MQRDLVGGKDDSPGGLPASSSRYLVGGWDRSAFVWGVWTVTVAVAMLLAYRSNRFPRSDDWSLISVLTGEQPVTLDWLWTPHVVHRIFLPKVAFVALYNSVLGYDFRAGVFLNVCILAALALAMVLAAKHLRGSVSYSDAALPIALLNSGGGGGVLWSFQLQFVSSTALASIVLLVIVCRGSAMTQRSSLLAGSCLMLLPLWGLNGLMLVPALASWLAYAGIRHRRLRAREDATAAIMLTFSIASILLCLTYFVGYPNRESQLWSPGLMATAKSTVAFLSAGFGRSFSSFLDGLPWWRLTVPAAVIVTGVVVGVGLARRPEDRSRGIGLLLFIVVVVSLAVAVGVGRGGRPWGGLDAHYGTLALPVLCWMYFSWEIYGSRAASRLGHMCLFALMCGVFALSTSSALSWGGSLRQGAEAVEKDILAGIQPCELTQRHIRFFYFLDTVETRDAVATGLRTLHRVGAGPLRLLRDEQPDAACDWTTSGMSESASNALSPVPSK